MNDTPDNTTEDQTQVTTADEGPKEIDLLKQRADSMGVKYSPNIGVDALRARVDAAMAGPVTQPTPPVEAGSVDPKVAMMKRRQEITKEQTKLVRLRIANLNPANRELSGGIYTVASKYVGIIKKFVPFGEATDNGYHVPYILYQHLKQRKFLQVRTHRDRSTGEIVVNQRWVPEFSLEVLPQLDESELKQLAASQAAAGGVN